MTYLIELNEWGYYEATNQDDCDALVLHDKTVKGLIDQINEL